MRLLVIITVILLVVACVSPLLTWLYLWQVKEWRWLRLMDHLKTEGYERSLLSRLRVNILAVWVLIGVVLLLIKNLLINARTVNLPIPLPVIPSFDQWLLTLTILLAFATVLQLLSRRQPLPVWTQKARTLLALSLVINVLIIVFAFTYSITALGKTGAYEFESYPYAWLAWVLVFVQPLIGVIAWTVTLPLDRFLKYRVLSKAKEARASHPHLTVIGITGSVGKTTMKELLGHLLQDKKPLFTPAHVNSEIGVARWLTHILKDEPQDSTKILIVEMGAYGIGEIALMCSFVRPTIGIITAIGTQHLSLFGSQENILQGKGELFEALPKDGLAFVNTDNAAGEALKKKVMCKAVSVGTAHADKLAQDIVEKADGMMFTSEGVIFHSPLSGTHSVVGTLMAITVAKTLGVSLQESTKLLKTFHPLEKTFHVKDVNGITMLDDTYNSSPQSVGAAIGWARGRSEQKKILVMEGIIELGSEEASIHRTLAADAANVFDEVFLAHTRFLPYFEDAFKEKAKLASGGRTMERGSLIVFCGRLSPSLIHRFLPNQT